MFPISVFLLWSVPVFLGAELWARTLYKKGKAAASRYSTNWNVRKVCEAFHQDLWTTENFEYKPHSRVRLPKGDTVYEVSINNMGFRGADLDLVSVNKDTLIIACIGGSTTVNGTSDDKTYPALLQEYLKNDRLPKPVIINCGIAGLNSNGYDLVLARLMEHVKPDMVIGYNAVNDICWKLFPYWKEQLSPLDRFLLRSQLVKYFLGDYFLPDDDDIRKDLDRTVISNMRSMAAMLEHHDIKLAVCSFIAPLAENGLADEAAYLDHNLRYWWQGDFISYRKYCNIVEMYNDALKEAFHGTNVRYIPLAESDVYTPNDFVDICHMKEDGIKKKARRLSILLRDHLE